MRTIKFSNKDIYISSISSLFMNTDLNTVFISLLNDDCLQEHFENEKDALDRYDYLAKVITFDNGE